MNKKEIKNRIRELENITRELQRKIAQLNCEHDFEYCSYQKPIGYFSPNIAVNFNFGKKCKKCGLYIEVSSKEYNEQIKNKKQEQLNKLAKELNYEIIKKGE